MNYSLLLSMVCCLIYLESMAQSCLPGGAFFNTQEQLDNFSAANPGCKVIEGNVNIHGSGILNLEGLAAITSMQGDLFITQTEQLSDLDGLHQLMNIKGAVRIQNNSALNSLEGLSKLNTIEGDYFYISSNPLLQNLQGLNMLDSIGGIVHINDMTGLKSLSGLGNVSYIGDRLSIFRCDSLTSLDGLSGLSEVGALDITDNPLLSSVQAFDHPVKINAQLVVTDNPELSECNVEAFCDYFIAPPSFVVFSNNGVGCSNRVQLEMECQTNSTYSVTQSEIKVFPNPATDVLMLDIPKDAVVEYICFFNMHGLTVRSAFNQNQIDICSLTPGMYFAQVIMENKLYHFSFIKN